MIDFEKLTEDYNNKRGELSFTTTSASQEGIESLFRTYPYLYDLPEEDLIREIGWQLHLLAFC